MNEAIKIVKSHTLCRPVSRGKKGRTFQILALMQDHLRVYVCKCLC